MFVGVPVNSYAGEFVGRRGDRLMYDSVFWIRVYLKKYGTNGMIRGIGADNPRMCVVWEVEGDGRLDSGLKDFK